MFHSGADLFHQLLHLEEGDVHETEFIKHFYEISKCGSA